MTASNFRNHSDRVCVNTNNIISSNSSCSKFALSAITLAISSLSVQASPIDIIVKDGSHVEKTMNDIDYVESIHLTNNSSVTIFGDVKMDKGHNHKVHVQFNTKPTDWAEVSSGIVNSALVINGNLDIANINHRYNGASAEEGHAKLYSLGGFRAINSSVTANRISVTNSIMEGVSSVYAVKLTSGDHNNPQLLNVNSIEVNQLTTQGEHTFGMSFVGHFQSKQATNLTVNGMTSNIFGSMAAIRLGYSKELNDNNSGIKPDCHTEMTLGDITINNIHTKGEYTTSAGLLIDSSHLTIAGKVAITDVNQQIMQWVFDDPTRYQRKYIAVGLHTGSNVEMMNGLIIKDIRAVTDKGQRLYDHEFAIVADRNHYHENEDTLTFGSKTDDVINQIEGNIKSYGGSVNGSFDNAYSYLQGATSIVPQHYNKDNKDDPEKDPNAMRIGFINLTFNHRSRWDVTDDSRLTHLKTTDGGYVDLTYRNRDEGATYRTVITDTFESENGQLHFSLDAKGGRDAADRLIIKADGTGIFDAVVHVNNADASNIKYGQPFDPWVMSQQSGILSVGKVHSQAGAVGTYELKFYENGSNVGHYTSTGKEGKWYVVPYLPWTDIGPSSPIIKPTPITPANPIIRPTPITPARPISPTPPVAPEVQDNVVIGVSASQAMAWLQEKSDLRKRLGEVRYGAQDGAWVRMDTRKEHINGNFKQTNHGIQIGADHLVGESEDSAWLLGGALRYAKADQKSLVNQTAQGSLDQYSAKLYATWMSDGGTYLDAVGQVGYYQQRLSGKDNTEKGMSEAEYSTHGYGLSLEFGHMFAFGAAADDRPYDNHWFIEPQAEVSYFVSHGQDYRTSTGLSVEQDSADFLNLRAGVVAGKKFSIGGVDSLDKRFVQVALHAGINHEFLGEQEILYRGTDGVSRKVSAEDMKGTRFYYGAMLDWQLSNDIKAYAHIEREQGHGYKKDYDVSIGMKYQF